MSAIPKKWEWAGGSEFWSLEIEHDRMKDGEPFVVTLMAIDRDADQGENNMTLVCATSEQAREMAAALTLYADYADRENARVSAESEGKRAPQ